MRKWGKDSLIFTGNCVSLYNIFHFTGPGQIPTEKLIMVEGGVHNKVYCFRREFNRFVVVWWVLTYLLYVVMMSRVSLKFNFRIVEMMKIG